MKSSDNDFRVYFERELSYLRKKGLEFAKRYPKIAGRLELNVDENPDPHIERLIESFAFLTARIQKNLDDEFPQLAIALLGNIYPQLLNPVPAMSTVQFNYVPGNFPSIPLSISKNHQLAAFTNFGEKCRFRTCYPVELWPLKITSVDFQSSDDIQSIRNIKSTSVLKIRLDSMAEMPVGKMNISHLRFHLHGERWLCNSLYELLFTGVSQIQVFSDNSMSYPVPQNENKILITPVGFGEDEALLPYTQKVNSGYRLIQEYFAFPDKFLFFDISGLNLTNADKYFTIYFILDNSRRIKYNVDHTNFLLGCTPVINLFQKISEPIRIDQLQTEYRINPDSQREQTSEIHSILSVSPSLKSTSLPDNIEPYFAFKHHKNDADEQKVYWYANRQPSTRQDIPGTEMFITLMDLNYRHTLPREHTLYAEILCMNRSLPELITTSTYIELETKLADLDISLLKKPTLQINAPQHNELWRLISSLSLNYLSLSSGEESLNALKEILSIYDFDNKADTRNQLAGVGSMAAKYVTRRLGRDNWRGFSRGIEITLEFDTEHFAGNSAFLLASVLNRFFPLYVTINSFTELVIKRKYSDEIWKRWNPRVGIREII
jgi:type VI secretion system protein ImpG